jgi:hypothetical protein
MPKEEHVVRVGEDFRLSYRVWELDRDGERSEPLIQSAQFALYDASHADDAEYLVLDASAEVDGNEVSVLLTRGTGEGAEFVNGGTGVAGLYEGRFLVDLGEETRKHYCLVEVKAW